METFKTLAAVSLAVFALWACTAAFKTPGGTAYYYGQVLFFSPDGKIPYGDTESAVKREIAEGGDVITETVTRPGAAHSMRPVELVTTLRRRGKTLVYDASEAGGSFSGTVTFDDRELKGWTYDIKLKAGGDITGSGRLFPDGIVTEKRLSGPGRPMTVKEDLKTVSEGAYRMRVEEMRPPSGAE